MRIPAFSQGERSYSERVEQAAGLALGTLPGGDAWARRALERLTRLPDVHRAGLALAEGGGRRLLFAASDRDNEPRIDWCHIDAYYDVPLNTSVRTGRPVAGSLDDLAARYPEFVQRQRSTITCGLAAAPLCAAGQVLGGFVVFYRRPQTFDGARTATLQEIGAHLGAALRRAQRATTLRTRSLAHEPVPNGARAVTHVVGGHPREVAVARRFLRATLEEWGVDPDTVDTAVLCLSELATNAIIHTSTGCEVRVVLDAGVLTTTVRDGGSSTVSPARAADDPLAVHGRGLQLVDAVARRWGSELDTLGTTVWFVLEPGT